VKFFTYIFFLVAAAFFMLYLGQNYAWMFPVSTNRVFSSTNYKHNPLSGAEEQTARAISAHAQCACLLFLQMWSMN